MLVELLRAKFGSFNFLFLDSSCQTADNVLAPERHEDFFQTLKICFVNMFFLNLIKLLDVLNLFNRWDWIYSLEKISRNE